MLSKLKTSVKTFSEKHNLNWIIDNFFYSYQNPTFIALIALLSYFSKVTALAFIVICLLNCIALIKYDDITPFIPSLLSVSFIFHDLAFVSFTNVWFYIGLVPLAAALIYHVIRFRPEKFRFGQLFVPILAVTVALFLGGIFSLSPIEYWEGVPLAITIGPVIFIIYIFLINYIKPRKDFDFKWFFAYSLMSIGFIIACQMMAYHLNDLNTYHLGWGNINIGSIMFLLSVPATAYLLCKAKVLLPYLAMIFFMFLGALLSDGEGVLAILAVFTPLLIFLVYKNMRLEKRKTFSVYIYLIIFALIALAALIVASGKLPSLINKLYVALTNDNDRTPLYKKAWELFKHNPIFGIGVGYYDDSLYEPIGDCLIRVFNFHCTLLHVMATMGLFGLIMYICYFFVRFRILMENRSRFNIMMFFSFGLFEIYGCLDPCEFVVMPSMIIATIVIVGAEIMNDFVKYKDPLWHNPKNAILKDKPYTMAPKQNKLVKLIYSL